MSSHSRSDSRSQTRRRAAIGGAALVSAAFLALAAAAPAFTATSSSPSTTVRKSVQTLMDANGNVQATRLYTQIQSTGDGTVSFTDSTSGSLRNLNGFGVPPVTDGTAQFDFAVNGLDNQRTLQDYAAGDLPITVAVAATLDGQPIQASDILGRSGLLKLTYTIVNRTAAPEQVSWTDGTGQTQTRTEQVPIPYVGSFTTVLPSSYADINAPGASMGGTGMNSTQLSYNLLLYKPLGDTTAVITYEARVTNADIPQVDLTFLPAGPADNPSTKSLQAQIKGGEDSGVKLTDAGTKIDAHLLELAAGAGQLNTGLSQLLTGAQQLSAGLNDTAVPGAKKLSAGALLVADGATSASSGANKLASGSGQVADGAALVAGGNAELATGAGQLSGGLAQLAGGAGQASAGGTQVAGGAALVSAGLGQLQTGISTLEAGVTALPTSIQTDPGYLQLKGALAAVQAGIGGVNDLTPTTLEGGMNLIRAGLDNPAVNFPAATGPCDPNAAQGATGYCGLKDALQLLGFGLDNPACNLADPTNPTNPCGALQGVNGVRTGLTGAGQPGGSIDQLSGGVAAAQAECQKILASGTADVANTTAAMTCVGILTQVSTGIEGPGGLRVQTKQGADSLGLVSNGLTAQALPAIAAMVAGIGTDAAPQTLLNGTARVKGGLSNPACSLADPQNTANPCGVSQVQGLVSAGIDQLVTAISTGIASAIGVASPGCDPAATLACGAAALGAGATTLSTGADQLATGLATLSSGSQQAASGASDLTTGADALASGSAQVASGADQVAAGNQDLATGLRKLSGGASKVSDGAGQLATGLAPAASGAGQISAGLAKAVPGGMAIEDGANQLSAQGSKALIATGNDTANSYGEQYAVMEALNARSATLAGVPDGPAKGAAVVTSGAFGYTLAGVSKADTSNELRFVLAGLLLAAAVGLGIAFARD